MSEYRMYYLKDRNGTRDVLRGVYGRIHEQGLREAVFYDGSMPDAEAFMTAMLRPGVLPYLATADGEPAAFVWLNGFEGRAARGHFVFFREFWGRRKSVPLGRFLFERLLTLRDGQGDFFDVLLGVTPARNPLAWRRAVDCGARLVGTLPRFCLMADGTTQDGVAVAVTRESLGIETAEAAPHMASDVSAIARMPGSAKTGGAPVTGAQPCSA